MDDAIFEIVVNDTKFSTIIDQPINVTINIIDKCHNSPYKIEWLKNKITDGVKIDVANDFMSAKVTLTKEGSYVFYVSVTDSKGRLLVREISISSVTNNLYASIFPNDINVEVGDITKFSLVIEGNTIDPFTTTWLTHSDYVLEDNCQTEANVIFYHAGEYLVSAYVYDKNKTIITSSKVTVHNNFHVINKMILMLRWLRHIIIKLIDLCIRKLNVMKNKKE